MLQTLRFPSPASVIYTIRVYHSDYCQATTSVNIGKSSIILKKHTPKPLGFRSASFFANRVFYFFNQFTWQHIKCSSKFPYRFKVCLLGSVFDHCKMRSPYPCKAAQDFLRPIAFFANLPDRLTNGRIVKLHSLTHSFYDCIRKYAKQSIR